MNTKILMLACLGLVASFSQSAYSDEVEGVFIGTVDTGGTGTVGKLEASTVAPGTLVFGTFSYNSQIFQVGPQ